MKLQRLDTLRHGANRFSEAVGSLLVDAFHYLALFAIGGAPSGRRCFLLRSW
jgi:hypothetical protein